MALSHVGGESRGVHGLQLQFHAGLGKVGGQDGHNAVHVGQGALVGDGEAQRLAVGALADAVAVGVHIAGILQDGGSGVGVKLGLTDVGSGEVAVNGADGGVHGSSSSGHGHVHQSLTIAAGGQGLTDVHILQQFVGLREGDEGIAQRTNGVNLIVGVALQLGDGRSAEEVGADVDLAVLQGQHHGVFIGIHAEYHFVNVGSGTVIGLREIGVALQSDILAVHPLRDIVGAVAGAGVRIGSGLFHRGPLALAHNGHPEAGALPEVHVAGSQNELHGAVIQAGGLVGIHQTIVAVEEADVVFHAVLGGEQQVLRGDGGAVVPVEFLQLDGPDGTVLVRLGGLGQVVILVAVVVHSHGVGADQVHNGGRVQVVLAPDVHAHGSAVQTHPHGTAGLGAFGGVGRGVVGVGGIVRRLAAAGCQ